MIISGIISGYVVACPSTNNTKPVRVRTRIRAVHCRSYLVCTKGKNTKPPATLFATDPNQCPIMTAFRWQTLGVNRRLDSFGANQRGGVIINWDAIGAVGEVLGAAAVLVTLVYLARQISQNTQEIRSSNYHGITNSFNSLNIMIATNSELARIFKEGNASFSELSEEGQTQYSFLMHSAFRVMDVLHYQSHHGTGDTTLWEAEKPTIDALLTPQGAQDWWRTRPFNFSADFVSYIDDVAIPRIQGDA